MHNAWMKRRTKTLYWIIWNRFQDNSLYAFGIRALKQWSMQTLTWDVDAAAVAGNSDAYSLALATQARQKWEHLNLH